MTNRRRSGLFNLYRTEFLRSAAWFARRDQWFAYRAVASGGLSCAGCGKPATKAELELHHLDYRGVVAREGNWLALEADDDLLALHPYCHELLHRLIDRDAVLSRNRSRREASHLALERLRPKLAALRETS